jgi:hypothetical protein
LGQENDRDKFDALSPSDAADMPNLIHNGRNLRAVMTANSQNSVGISLPRGPWTTVAVRQLLFQNKMQPGPGNVVEQPKEKRL